MDTGKIAFGKLRQVFSSPIPQCLKTKVFNQCILPVMTYEAETWTVTIGLVHQFKVSQRAVERAMLGVSLKDRIRNEYSTAAVENYIYIPNNANRSTISGIAAYRSALTLDWLADEDNRQRELAGAFETEATPQGRVINTDCIVYPRPASGKVARLMLELLKNLEGDDGMLISELTQALIRSKLLVETFMLDAEPDLDALVKTPGLMLGEPYASFPRVLAMVWMAATDPTTTKRHGWCLISKVTKFLRVSRPVHVAEQLRALDPIIARARFIIEEFIQHVTPINVFEKKNFGSPNVNGNRNTKRSERGDDSGGGTTDSITEATRTHISAIIAGDSKRLLGHPGLVHQDELSLREDAMALPERQTHAHKRSSADVVRCNNVVAALAFAVMFF